MIARPAGALVIALFFTANAAADVTLKQKSGARMAMGGSADGTMTQYIKGTRMRVDEAMTGAPTSTIIDLNAQQLVVLNHKRREADVYDMAKLGAQVAKIPTSDVRARLTPAAQTRQIAGSTCAVHNMHVSVPTEMAGEQITLVISGPVCVSKNAPGQAEFSTFYKAGAQKGMFLGDPRTAAAQPGHAKGLATLHQEIAALGVPLAQEMTVKFEGSGPMAGMMAKVGGSKLTTEVVSIATDSIADSVFEIPAGYTINKR
jgi:hypothetical protein